MNLVPVLRILAVGAAVTLTSFSGGFAEETTPEVLLKSHGLKRSGSAYILASEADVQKKISEARLISRKLNYSVDQQRAFEHGTGRQESLYARADATEQSSHGTNP